MNFKNIVRRKQADYFESNYGITEFATVKRKPKGCTEPIEFYVPALLKWEDAKDGKIFYEGYRADILKVIYRLRQSSEYTPSGIFRVFIKRYIHL